MSSAHQPLNSDLLYALAPRQLPSYRQVRYDGDGMGVALSDFPPADRQLIGAAYTNLSELFEWLQARQDQPGEDVLGELVELEQRLGWRDLVLRMRRLGNDLPIDEQSRRLRQVAHDLRGGGFQALSVYMQLAELGITTPNTPLRMFFLARDQLKIIRNGVRGLDDARRNLDRGQRLHWIELLAEKWSRGDYRLQDLTAEVRFDCRYSGAIAERCLEFSALDRVIYNLMNNAARHTDDGTIELVILPLEQPITQNLRFVVANPISALQHEHLAANFPNGLGALFEGGFTTGGSGLGLRICADFIVNAYGLRSIEQGLSEGHFGATLLDERFVSWFHWPVAAE